ncbi:MAG: GNAT family N-acetyltransferase [Deltaproteobacteria bacterium]|nr:GNAT family N-acetyltransferase [Deltaproteobacteria bacterium]
MSPPARPLRVRLTPITYGELDQLLAMFLVREVWRNFGYPRPPTLFRLRMAWRQREGHGHFIDRTDGGQRVGFAVYFGDLSPDDELEFGIAIPDPALRRLGLAHDAVLAVEQEMLGKGRCKALWAWMDESNRAVLELAEWFGWTVTGREKRAQEMVDGMADVKRIRLSAADYPAVAARRPPRAEAP